MKEHYEKNEEIELLDKKFVTPAFIIISILLVLSLSLETTKAAKEKEICKVENYLEDESVNQQSENLEILKSRIRYFCIETNKSLPIRIDDYTQLDAVLFTGNLLFIKYLVDDVVKEVMDDELRKQQKKDVENMVRSMIKEFGGVPSDLVKLGVVFQYVYYTRSGDIVLRFTINPKDLK